MKTQAIALYDEGAGLATGAGGSSTMGSIFVTGLACS